MPTRPIGRKIAAGGLAAVLALGAVACGEDEEPSADDAATTQAADESTDSSDAMTDEGSEGGDPTATPAAELRATLTAGLQEHVYLAGITVYAAVNTPEAFDPAAAALDENSVALSEAVGGVYGDDAGETFLGLWRDHIGMFVDYTNGKASGDQAAADAALAELEQYGQDFGAFLEGANPNLPADAVAAELSTHVTSLTAAIDAVVAGDAEGFSLLRAAAGHMPMTAAVLAGGIAAQHPDQFGA